MIAVTVRQRTHQESVLLEAGSTWLTSPIQMETLCQDLESCLTAGILVGLGTSSLRYLEAPLPMMGTQLVAAFQYAASSKREGCTDSALPLVPNEAVGHFKPPTQPGET